MRHIPGVMTRSTLGDRVVESKGIRIFREFAVGVSAVGIAKTGVYDFAVILGTTHQFVIILGLAKFLRYLGESEVVESIFKSPRRLFFIMESLFDFIFQRYVSVLQV